MTLVERATSWRDLLGEYKGFAAGTIHLQERGSPHIRKASFFMKTNIRNLTIAIFILIEIRSCYKYKWGIFMDNFGTILLLLSMVGIILAIIGIIKGSVKFLKIKGRKKSTYLLIAAIVLFIIGGSILPAENSEIALETNTTHKEEAVVNTTVIKSVDKVEPTNAASPTPTATLKEVQKAAETPTTPTGILEVHYIDVGQGASQLVMTPNGNVMLIDGGNNDDEQRVVNYLKKQGVSKVDILIGTHPDADHVGGLDKVVDAFEIGSIYMPKVSSTTKTFESLLTSIANKKLKVTTAKAGVELKLDEHLTVNMIAPINTYDDANEMSAVIKMTFGSNAFLFTGDAESKSENDLLADGTNLKSDVLLVGHHGSNSSTSQSFLNAVNPKYAVIQVGKNSYGHPTSEIIKRLNDKKINIYRNDTQGTIIFSSDGENITTSQNAWKPTATLAPKATAKSSAKQAPKVTTKPVATQSPKSATPKPTEQLKQESVSYANCTAVREAGADPIHEGDPGYSRKLDRDGDGVGCE